MTHVTLNGIRQIALAVSNIDASVHFYEKVLGFTLLFRAEPKMAFFDIEGTRLMLSQSDVVTTGGPILYFGCIDIENTGQKMKKSGVEIIRQPLMAHKTKATELWLAFFKDPDAHTLALYEEKMV